MRGGRLDKVIVIESFTTAQNDTGEEVETWATFATVRADRQDISGKESFKQDTPVAETTTLFTIRYLAGLKASMRIIYDSGTYDIEEIKVIARERVIEIKAINRAI